jgi:protein O-GlcNAc transferase
MSEQILQNAMRLHQSGRLPEAARLYKEVLRGNPRHFQALYLLGYVHFQKGEFEDAERLIGDALKLNPASPDGYYNRGCALQKLKRDEEALVCFDRALALKPDYPEALFNRGTALIRLQRYAAAAAVFERLIVRTPRDAEAWHNRGDALGAMGRHGDAIASYNRALALAPDMVRALGKRAGSLMNLKHYQAAAEDFARVVELEPDFDYALGNLVYSRLNCCDWRGLDENRRVIASELYAGKHVISPLQYFIFSDSPQDQLQCSSVWANTQCPTKQMPLWRGERYGHDKIRVTYISRDFRTHAVSLLLAGIIEQHDRDRFEVTAISFGPDDDSPARLRLKKAFDRFIDVDTKTDRETAQLLRDHETDIAVDLMGYTGGFRTGILAYRPAPVQVNYLGFPGTSGTDFIDYIIADATVIPEEHFPYYSEKVVHLPDTFQPNDSRRRVAETRPARAHENLPADGFVFCSFNNSCKIMPTVFDVWMRLLSQVEDSVLWLPEYNDAEPGNLRREAQSRGIAPERLIFAQLVATPEEYLARLSLADLFLDTMPYNAHTTASDALWMGLPVVTFVGTTFAGRVAASLLRCMGAPELVAQSLAEYEALALRLARNRDELLELRRRLGRNRDTGPLFDTRHYCRNLEAAFRTMWERSERGEPPAHFAVSP